MRMILIYLPLLVLALGFLFGQIRILPVAVFFLAWIAGCVALAFVAMAHMMDPSGLFWLAAAVFATAVAIPAAIVFGALFSTPISPAPVVVAARSARVVYDGLDEEDKQMVRKAGWLGVKLGLVGFADFLRHKSWHSTASVLKEAATSL